MTRILIERYRGALVGLACGDAVGTTNEFSPPGTFLPIDDMVGGGVFNLKAGEWTDDTTMALCLAESLVEKEGFDPHDQMDKYVKWYRKGYLSVKGFCFDIGGATASALMRYEKTGHPYAGDRSLQSSGNGSIMRLAPVVLFFAARPELAVRMAGKSSITTHGSPLSVDGCRLLAALILGALQGKSKEEILSGRCAPSADYWYRYPLAEEMRDVMLGSYKRKNPPYIRGTGFVVESLEAALWAFYHSNSFEEGALMAANLGDDADTTGAVYGQLAGAYYGDLGIPPMWRLRVAEGPFIRYLAEMLYELRIS